MHDPLILIRTAWGPGIGMGHVQRMASLAWHLRKNYGIPATLWIEEAPSFLPPGLPIHTGASPPDGTMLLVRDMRESTPHEIETLKRIAPVLVLDDMGAGGRLADFTIDLLPVPTEYREHRAPVRDDLFLYGYSFLHDLEEMGAGEIEKSTDILFYAGADSNAKYLEQGLALIPAGKSCAVFSGVSSFLAKDGTQTVLGQSDYVRMLLSARLLISHFGITMYEACAAGCAVVAINPTEYHARLCDLAPERFALKNLGVRDRLDSRDARAVIAEALEGTKGTPVRPADVYRGARENLDRFAQILIKMIGK